MPPIVNEVLLEELQGIPESDAAKVIINEIHTTEMEAHDNLLMAKVQQVYFANDKRGVDDVFKVGDRVMLLTLNRCAQYKKKNEKRVAKFLPHFNRPYEVVSCHPETSNYTIDMPNSPLTFPTFHSSELKRHVDNDAELFPHREMAQPGPVLMEDSGLEEYTVELIIDVRARGRGHQYLVSWVGYGPEHDQWLPRRQLEECEVLDVWLATHKH